MSELIYIQEIEKLKQENETLKKQLKQYEPNTFAKRLRILRCKEELTQLELANYLNINRMTVVKWEKETSEPNLSQLKKLIKYLNTTFDYLAGEDNENI